jgi:hypothetical protein
LIFIFQNKSNTKWTGMINIALSKRQGYKGKR